MEMKAVGIRIKLCRERSGMTQVELAGKLGCTPQHISAVERGVKTPKLETFVDIANVLEVQPNLLLQDVIAGWEKEWETELDRVLEAVPPAVRRRIRSEIMTAKHMAEELREGEAPDG